MAAETFAANGGYAISVGGVLTQVKTVAANGAYDVAYFGVIGQAFMSYDVFYSAAGQKTSETWSNDSVLYRSETWNADGSTDIRYYATGSFAGLSYASYDVHTTASALHDATTYYDANGDVVASETFHVSGRGADCSAPPPPMPACGFPAPGSCRKSDATNR